MTFESVVERNVMNADNSEDGIDADSLELFQQRVGNCNLTDFQGHTIAVPYGRFNLQLAKRRRARCTARLGISRWKTQRRRWPPLRRRRERTTGTWRSPLLMPAPVWFFLKKSTTRSWAASRSPLEKR